MSLPDSSASRSLIPWLAIVLVALVGAPPLLANSTQVLISHGLISQEVGEGGDLFFRETFGGNGRTCGSCHSVEDNQTISPDFIATLPPTDPLFVSEFDPNLSQLEISLLLREYGLILENVDGGEDPTHKFVMRGTPASLSLATTIDQPPGSPLPPDPLGNSGDGAFAGTLNSFPTGATMQHFTKTLNRVEGVDFRLPTQDELDKMEAFMLQLGRTQDIDLQAVTLTDADAEAGLQIFLNDGSNPSIAAGKCNICHSNAGANYENGGGNRNFDIGIEQVPHPARALIPFPFDGGFGKEPNPDGTFGDGTFNTQPLVEAADSGPWFHNHVIDNLEEAVAYFSSSYFANSPAADPDTGVGPISLLPQESDQVAAFLRVLNASFNLDITNQRTTAAISLENSSSKCGGGGGILAILTGNPGDLSGAASGGGGFKCPDSVSGGTTGTRATVDTLLALANVEAADALQDLTERGLNPTAASLIQQGIDKNQQAINENASNTRKSLMQSALADFQNAKAALGSGMSFTMGQANLMF